MSGTYETRTDGLTVDMIDSIEGGSGYDWETFALMRGSDGLLYVASDGGCSCSYFGDIPLDVEPVKNWQEAATKAQEWGGQDSETMQFIERLTKSSPAATTK